MIEATTPDAFGALVPATPRLFGVPAHAAEERGRIVALGVPFDLGNGIAAGGRAAPAAIRAASIAADASCAHPFRTLRDAGDVRIDPGEGAEAVARRVAEVCRGLVARGARPLIVGGDHSVTFGAVSGLDAVGELIVVWIDAHTDIDQKTLATGLNHKNAARRTAMLPHVARVVVVGHRGYTREDETRCLPGRLAVVPGHALRRRGVDEVHEALDRVDPDLPLYLSIDIDVLCPSYAPGTAAPVPDGLAPAEVAGLLEALAARRGIVGCDLVEVNPAFDDAGRTLDVACGLLARAVGALAVHDTRSPAPRAATPHDEPMTTP